MNKLYKVIEMEWFYELHGDFKYNAVRKSKPYCVKVMVGSPISWNI